MCLLLSHLPGLCLLKPAILPAARMLCNSCFDVKELDNESMDRLVDKLNLKLTQRYTLHYGSCHRTKMIRESINSMA